jgi:hypothetical protein
MGANAVNLSDRKVVAYQADKHLRRDATREEERLGASLRRVGDEGKRATAGAVELFGIKAIIHEVSLPSLREHGTIAQKRFTS